VSNSLDDTTSDDPDTDSTKTRRTEDGDVGGEGRLRRGEVLSVGKSVAGVDNDLEVMGSDAD
jgi:hypothetical protein